MFVRTSASTKFSLGCILYLVLHLIKSVASGSETFSTSLDFYTHIFTLALCINFVRGFIDACSIWILWTWSLSRSLIMKCWSRFVSLALSFTRCIYFLLVSFNSFFNVPNYTNYIAIIFLNSDFQPSSAFYL
jgi:hypothetical protein